MSGRASDRPPLTSSGGSADAWSERARWSFQYRGESIYTITPIPFYLARRRLLVQLMQSHVAAAARVCDYGCGDGWYLRHFAQLSPAVEWTGVDVAPGMLELAAQAAPQARLFLPDEDWGQRFDLIYCVAVLAHVDDELLMRILSEWSTRLAPGGRILIFEQVGPHTSRGAGYVRRAAHDYLAAFTAAGYELQDAWRLSFDAHRWFERHVAKLLYTHWYDAETDTQRRLQANQSRLFRGLSRLSVMLSRNRLKRDLGDYGNALMLFGKGG